MFILIINRVNSKSKTVKKVTDIINQRRGHLMVPKEESLVHLGT